MTNILSNVAGFFFFGELNAIYLSNTQLQFVAPYYLTSNLSMVAISITYIYEVTN